MVAADTRRGKYLTATSIFRGRMSTREVETSLKLIKDKNSEHFVNWIPDNAKIAICDIPPRGVRRAATFFANNTSIAAVWVRILEQYRAMYRRRAYLHWYLGEGMETSDFEIAETTLLDLIDEYIPLSSNGFPGDEEDDDDIDGDYQTAGKRPFDATYPAQSGGARPKTAAKKTARTGGDGDGGQRERGGGGGGGEGGRVLEVDLGGGPSRYLDKIAETSAQASPKSSPKTSTTSAEVPAADQDDLIDGNGVDPDPDDETAANAADPDPDDETAANASDAPLDLPSWDVESYYRQQEQLPVFRDTDDREEEAAREEEEAAREEEEAAREEEEAQPEDRSGSGGRKDGDDDKPGGKEETNDNDDDDDDDDYLKQFVSNVREKKKKSQESHEFDKIMERKDKRDDEDGEEDDNDF